MRSIMFITGLVIVLTTSLTTTAFAQSTAKNWQGSHIETVIAHWGPPNLRIPTANGNVNYIYKSERLLSSSYPAAQFGVAGTQGKPVVTTYPNNTSQVNQEVLFCVMTLTVNHRGLIIQQKTAGNDCAAMPHLINKMPP